MKNERIIWLIEWRDKERRRMQEGKGERQIGKMEERKEEGREKKDRMKGVMKERGGRWENPEGR